MTAKENLLRLIELLPEDKLEELERFAISLLAESRDETEPAPRQRVTFEEAKARVFEQFDDTFRRLADS